MTKQILPTLKITVVLVIFLIVILFFRSLAYSSLKINRNHAAVVTQIQQLNRLETSVFTIEKIIDARTSGNIFQRMLFGDKILLIAHGKVVAGVDLSKLNENQIQISKKSITITLPPSEIFVSDLDETQTEVYDRSRGILTKGDKDLESEARKAAESEILKAACDGGILTEAAKSAKLQITNLLQALEFTEINVTALPGSC